MVKRPEVIGVEVVDGITIHRYESRPAKGCNSLMKWSAARGGHKGGVISVDAAKARIPSMIFEGKSTSIGYWSLR